MLKLKLLAAVLIFGIGGMAIAGPVNINTADAKTLAKELDSVGSKTADAIVKEREKGPFKSAEDFEKRVPGIGPKTLEKNKANIKVSDK